MKAEDFLKEKSGELNSGIFRTSSVIYGNADILKAFHRHQNKELIEEVMFLKADVEAKQKTVNSLYKYITDLKAILSNDNQKT